MPELQAAILYVMLFVALFFEVFLLITYMEVREQLKFEAKLGKDIKRFPSATIIVPCFNEERTISGTVRSILNLDYPRELLKIILVNDGSTDGTWEELMKFEKHHQVKVYSKENGGKHTALNFALEKVDTELVGCLDADSFVNPDALKKIVPFFDDEMVMAVTPSIKVHEPKNILQYIQKVEYSWGIFLRRMLSSIGALYVTPGPFSIFRTKIFAEIGGYRHGHSTEDMEMAMRLQKNRYKIVNSHGAHVYTVTPDKFKALYKQRVRWTYGFLNNAIDYRDMFFNRQYGHIGLFIMPIATLSIFTTLYGTGSAIWSFTDRALETFTRWQTVGFSISALSFDWYFLNTSVMTLLTVTAIALTVAILLLALKLSNGTPKPDRGLIYYLVLYIFIVPLWLAKAVWNTITRRQVSWR